MIPVIAIDAGHGGSELGTTWPLSWPFDTLDLVEKDIALLLARLLARGLEEEGNALALTREGDYRVSFASRRAVAQKHGADLVVSIHVNSSPDPEAQGMMTFARHGDVVGARVAQVIAANAPDCYRRKRNAFFECRQEEVDDREWLQRASNVVHAFPGVPTVLVEAFHITNAKDRLEWDMEGAPGGVVRAIMMGIDCFKMLTGAPVPVAGGGRPYIL